MFVDSHCHLDRLDLTAYNNALSLALKAAVDAGVDHILCVSVDLDNIEKIIATTEFPGVFASVGVHPLETDTFLNDTAMLDKLTAHPKVIAVGETGLDYHYDTKHHKTQQNNFALHLELGKEKQLPVIVHTRDARADTINLMKSHACPNSAGVMHCFTESWDMAKKSLDMNFYISFSGIVTFKNAKELQEVAKKVPLDRMLIETDAPYLAPVPYRGKPNEPRFVREVGHFLAQLKNVSVGELARITSDNFFKLFSKADKSNLLAIS